MVNYASRKSLRNKRIQFVVLLALVVAALVAYFKAKKKKPTTTVTIGPTEIAAPMGDAGANIFKGVDQVDQVNAVLGVTPDTSVKVFPEWSPKPILPIEDFTGSKFSITPFQTNKEDAFLYS